MSQEFLFDIPIMSFANSEEWNQWISKNHTDQTGVWIKVARKSSGIPSVSPPEALDEALCYGWIDGQRRSLDETYYLQKYTPRRKKSLWSKVNIEKVGALTAAGRMQAPGQAAIDAAKADGRWDAAYESQRNAVVPADLQQVLDANEPARVFFETLTRAERYSVLHQLMTAPNETVRKNRLDKMLVKLTTGQKV